MYFEMKKRLRQGDPISPYLFVLCLDKLTHMIGDRPEEGKRIDLKVGKQGRSIYFMFVHDILLYGKGIEN